jgi:hypothetical protein
LERKYALVGLDSNILDALLVLGNLTFLCDLQHPLQRIDEENGHEDEGDFEL